jgi:hypothetical protein
MVKEKKNSVTQQYYNWQNYPSKVKRFKHFQTNKTLKSLSLRKAMLKVGIAHIVSEMMGDNEVMCENYYAFSPKKENRKAMPKGIL